MKNLNGLTLITGKDCPKCPGLKLMLKRLGVKYREMDIAEAKFYHMDVKSLPELWRDGKRIFYGCPGSLDDLKKIIGGK